MKCDYFKFFKEVQQMQDSNDKHNGKSTLILRKLLEATILGAKKLRNIKSNPIS